MYFLEQTAQWLLKHFEDQLLHVQVVFPNKRPGVFFMKYLSQKIIKPTWSPQIFDIESFVIKNSGYSLADPITQIFQLYQIYSEILKKNGRQPESIDVFYPWGNIILNDFSEIDKNLCQPQEVFRLIDDIKTIDNLFNYLTPEQIDLLKSFWSNLNIETKTENKEKFLRMWQILPEMYDKLKDIQIQTKTAYSGFIYRKLAEAALNKAWISDNGITVFAGFHFLNKAESSIFRFLKDSGKAVFLWDTSQYYLDKNDFPPYDTIRNNIRNFPMPDDFEIFPGAPMNSKNINIYSVSMTSAQVNVAGEILKKLSVKSEQGTAVVMADEKMLIPMIHALSEDIDRVNITMGYPLIYSYPADLIQQFADFFKKYPTADTAIPSAELIRLITHPLVAKTNYREYQQLSDELTNQNQRVVYLDNLKERDDPFIAHLIRNYKQTNQLTEKLSELCRWFIENEKITEIEKDFFHELLKSLNRLNELVQKEQLEDTLTSKLIKEVIYTLRIAFSGEPLTEIQLLGILETRCLDFENLIILSLNEGIWPSKINQSTFIPYQVRKAFYLNTPENDDNVYAYYFYRLFQHALNIHLIYSTDTDAFGYSEKSRYLLQLIYDFNLQVKELPVSPRVKVNVPQKIYYEKNEYILRKLDNYLNPVKKIYFSPSALNTFLDCKLKFLFQHILKIKEKDKIREEIDDATFGKIVHRSLELLYSEAGKQNRLITSSDIKNMLENYSPAVSKALQEIYLNGSKIIQLKGYDLIVIEIIKNYTEKILKYDLSYTPFEILSLEGSPKNFRFETELNLNGEIITPGIYGITDRIDLKNKIVRAVDYKTGKDTSYFSSVESLFEHENPNRNKAAFQILCYCLIMKHSGKFSEHIQPAIYVIREINKFNYSPLFSFGNGKNKTILENFDMIEEEFHNNLKNLFKEIFSPDIPFSPAKNEKICSFCPYIKICGRK